MRKQKDIPKFYSTKGKTINEVIKCSHVFAESCSPSFLVCQICGYVMESERNDKVPNMQKEF